MRPTSVLATISGRDRPGVTAAFFAALAAHDVDVRDVEQVVIRDRLILAVLLDLRGDPTALRASVSQAANALGMESEVAIAPPSRPGRGAVGTSLHHVIVLGQSVRPGVLSHVAQVIADAHGNIESVTQFEIERAASLEMLVRAPDPIRLRAALVTAAEETGMDLAVEPAVLRRRAKRLVVLGVDTTLIQDDVIDMLAARNGVAGEVAAITQRAMAGALDFADSLRARVALLAGLTSADLDAAREGLRLTPGARTFVHTLRRSGYYVGVVSGGFSFVTDRFEKELQLDFAAANELEVVDGVVTGRVVGDILDRSGRAMALRRFAEKFSVPLSQTVAVGTGANDVEMLEAAGLGLASSARSAQREPTAAWENPPYVDSVLFVLGISGTDAAEAAADLD